jgi:hypothetical protein
VLAVFERFERHVVQHFCAWVRGRMLHMPYPIFLSRRRHRLGHYLSRNVPVYNASPGTASDRAEDRISAGSGAVQETVWRVITVEGDPAQGL